MLPHYSAFKVAETFSLLAGLFPGRIDLGIGRAAGTDPVTTLALQRERDHAVADDFADQLAELLAYLDGRIPPEHPFARLLETLPGRPQLPAPWLLGSSPQSAVWAAELGLPYAFADFINSQGAEIAAAYRERFQPQPARATALTEPCTAVAAWVVCADTDEEAERVAASGRMAFTMLRRGTLGPVPSPDRAERFLAEEAARRGREDEGAVARAPRRRTIVGSPEKVRAGVLALASEYGAQEVIAVNVTWSHEARVRSYELLAQALLGSAARLDLDDQLARAGADDVAAV
jgi:luciferase family oxidoreductase group 1